MLKLIAVNYTVMLNGYSQWVNTHIAIFLWPSSGPHNQLSLGPHTAMTYGPSVDQVWIPDKGHTWAITGPIQGQLWVINLTETWASYGPCVALVWNPDLVHTRTISHCGMWAKRKLILWAGAGPEKNCYVGRSWARDTPLDTHPSQMNSHNDNILNKYLMFNQQTKLNESHT